MGKHSKKNNSTKQKKQWLDSRTLVSSFTTSTPSNQPARSYKQPSKRDLHRITVKELSV